MCKRQIWIGKRTIERERENFQCCNVLENLKTNNFSGNDYFWDLFQKHFFNTLKIYNLWNFELSKIAWKSRSNGWKFLVFLILNHSTCLYKVSLELSLTLGYTFLSYVSPHPFNYIVFFTSFLHVFLGLFLFPPSRLINFSNQSILIHPGCMVCIVLLLRISAPLYMKLVSDFFLVLPWILLRNLICILFSLLNCFSFVVHVSHDSDYFVNDFALISFNISFLCKKFLSSLDCTVLLLMLCFHLPHPQLFLSIHSSPLIYVNLLTKLIFLRSNFIFYCILWFPIIIVFMFSVFILMVTSLSYSLKTSMFFCSSFTVFSRFTLSST